MELGILINLLVFFLGLFLGHRLQISNDRRKEFNEVSGPYAVQLEIQRRTLLSGKYPGGTYDEDDFIEIQRRIGIHKRRGFIKAVKEYVAAKQNCGEFVKGQYKLTAPELLISKIDNLLRYLSHR